MQWTARVPYQNTGTYNINVEQGTQLRTHFSTFWNVRSCAGEGTRLTTPVHVACTIRDMVAMGIVMFRSMKAFAMTQEAGVVLSYRSYRYRYIGGGFRHEHNKKEASPEMDRFWELSSKCRFPQPIFVCSALCTAPFTGDHSTNRMFTDTEVDWLDWRTDYLHTQTQLP